MTGDFVHGKDRGRQLLACARENFCVREVDTNVPHHVIWNLALTAFVSAPHSVTRGPKTLEGYGVAGTWSVTLAGLSAE